jgi:short subunit dehydrogenase-like uncharacterized protein
LVLRFTGERVVYDLLRQPAGQTRDSRPLRVALAGRSQTRLDEVNRRCLALGLTQMPLATVVADVQDEASLVKMAERTAVVIACVGPYRFYGEPVVKVQTREGVHGARGAVCE